MKLQSRPLTDVLKKRYKWSDEAAREFADFLLPMLHYDPRRRATAEQCLRHPWLQTRQRPASSAAADSSSPPTAEQDKVESAQEAVMPGTESRASDTVVVETKCDAASETGRDDNALRMTPLAAVDTSAWLATTKCCDHNGHITALHLGLFSLVYKVVHVKNCFFCFTRLGLYVLDPENSWLRLCLLFHIACWPMCRKLLSHFIETFTSLSGHPPLSSTVFISRRR